MREKSDTYSVTYGFIFRRLFVEKKNCNLKKHFIIPGKRRNNN